MAQINLNEGLFSNLAVVGRFLDIDHLTSMCVQLPKQETVKTAESKITTVIYLKHTLELVEPLRLALKDTEAELFKAYYEVLDVSNNWEWLWYIIIHDNNLSPSYLTLSFTNTSHLQARNLRHSETNYYVPRPRTEYSKGAHTTEDLFCWTTWTFHQKSDTFPVQKCLKSHWIGNIIFNAPWIREVFISCICISQSLNDSRFATIMERIQNVIHDDTRYQKGTLNMRTQKCFAVKVRVLLLF